LACRERYGVYRLVQGVGRRICVNPNTAEIDAKRRVHLAADAAVERLPTTAGALDLDLHLLGCVSFAGRVLSQEPLYVTISPLPLELQQRMPTAARWRL